MTYRVSIIGGGLAGCECALNLAARGISVTLYEMRPHVTTPVHHSSYLAELVCSNSLKSQKPDTAAGLLKQELASLNSPLFATAQRHSVAAGGALAVDRVAFAEDVSRQVLLNPFISLERREVESIAQVAQSSDAVVLATGPLTSDSLAHSLTGLTGQDALAFYDAAAPIVMAESIDRDKVFRQSRWETQQGQGDYLNAPFTKEEYERFIDELLAAQRVIAKDFESRELFQACQPIEEIARAGRDAPRFGALKPVGLIDPRTEKRPWAALQLRAEDAYASSYNLVGFQTNLTFPEQRRVFRMIPGLEEAQFARYGVMHRNTFIDAPRLLNASSRLVTKEAQALGVPIYVVGQLSGTEGYCEAMRSGLHGALAVSADLQGVALPELSRDTVFGALLAYATDESVKDYQPMHVNFGLMRPLEHPVRNKRARYSAYAQRANDALGAYRCALEEAGLLP